ncbi:MAG: phosphoglucomutase/phosphomannomutase family protein [bacterium]
MTSNGNEIKFGTDGWRGLLARDFTFENVRRVAQATADYIKMKGAKPGESRNKPVIIGYDRRFLSDRFALTVAEVLRASKIDAVLMDEPMPTPAVSLMTLKKFSLGVMITASHNSHLYNGLKIKTEGRAAPEHITAELETLATKAKPLQAREIQIPSISFRKTYLGYLRSRINVKAMLSRLARPVVIDCMHGCASALAGELLPSKKVIVIRTARDPMFGGINPEPVEKNLEALAKAVKKEKAAAGIALDGDADRVGLVDDAGHYMTPCQVFPILLEHLKGKGALKGKIVQAVSLGYLSQRIAAAAGLEFEEVPVGFKFIAEKMLAGNVAAGAEESGGYSWKGNLPERDGLLTALLVMEMLTSTSKSLSQLYAAVAEKYGRSFFTRKDFALAKPVADKTVFAEKLRKKIPKNIQGRPVHKALTMDGLKIILDNGHWLLMRPSGTEPLLRTYAETDSPVKTKELLELAAKMTAQYF